MNWISTSFFLISSLICLTQFRKGADIISPARVFGLTWSLVFALTNLKLSGLQQEWTLVEWLYALLGPISFILGLSISHVMNMGVSILPIAEIRSMIRKEKVDEGRLFWAIVAAFVTYIVGYVVIAVVKGYVPLFAPNPARARIDFFIFGIGLFIHHMPIVFFFSLVYFILVRDNHPRKNILKIIVFFTVLTYFFLLQRYQLMMIAVMAFALLYYSTRRIKFGTLMLFAIAGILVVYLVATLRAGQVLTMILYLTSRMKYSPEYAIFTEPYMYVSMNMENFVNAVSKLDQHTYGFYTFDFAFAITGLKHPLREYFGLLDSPFLVSGYNTYSMFWPFFRDFGIAGISLLPLVGGLLVSSVYYAMRRNATIEHVSLYSVMVFVMALSFFLSPLGFLWFVYIVFWMVLVFRFVRVKNAGRLVGA